MPKSYLRKYFDDNNPVVERLNINKKLFTRVIIYCVFSLIYIILRIINNRGVFDDFASPLRTLISAVMIISGLIAIVGVITLILSLVMKTKFLEMFNKIPFDKKKLVFTIIDFYLVIPICVCIAIFTYGHLFRIQMVSGPSMEPSFYDGERIVSTYNIDDIKRGDVVICDIDKESFNEEEDMHIIKRIVGMPGDEIKWENGILYVNGDDIYEDYISKSTGKNFDGNFFIYENSEKKYLGNKIPEGYVFVLGDNRGDSKDSRGFGLIPIEKILGIVVLKVDGFKPSIVERGVLE